VRVGVFACVHVRVYLWLWVSVSVGVCVGVCVFLCLVCRDVALLSTRLNPKPKP
jgi:hypothetical protein